MEEQIRGQVEASTQPKSYKEGRKRTKEVEKLVQDAQEHMGAPTS